MSFTANTLYIINQQNYDNTLVTRKCQFPDKINPPCVNLRLPCTNLGYLLISVSTIYLI